MKIVSLPYSLNSAAAFAAVADLPAPVWLDSGRPLSCGGRFDIISADPLNTLVLSADSPRPFTQLDDLIRELCPQDRSSQLPFCGGAIGSPAMNWGWRATIYRQIPAQPTCPQAFSGFIVGLLSRITSWAAAI